MPVTLELLKPGVSHRSGETKYVLVIAGIVLSIIVVFGIVTIALSTDLSSSYSSTKNAICSAKVLELAQKGIVRDVGGYYGAIYECTHMHGLSSVYGKASE
jgi:hypothetical protein